jgi:hypothetical protein
MKKLEKILRMKKLEKKKKLSDSILAGKPNL